MRSGERGVRVEVRGGVRVEVRNGRGRGLYLSLARVKDRLFGVFSLFFELDLNLNEPVQFLSEFDDFLVAVVGGASEGVEFNLLLICGVAKLKVVFYFLNRLSADGCMSLFSIFDLAEPKNFFPDLLFDFGDLLFDQTF